MINEVASSGDDPVELLNTGDADVDLSGYTLTDGDPDAEGHAYVIPDATVLAPGARLVLEKDRDHAFGLGDEDAAQLFDPDGALVDRAAWGPGEADVSYCRTPDGEGPLAPCDEPTLGAPNRE